MPLPLHWPRDLTQAREEQSRLARRVSLADRRGPVRVVAGVDVHYRGGKARAAATLLSFPGLELLSTATAVREAPFPYISGYLNFREAPAALAALEALSQKPHLLLADGQGIAHPRGLGLACHLGVLSGLMTIGVAKSRLVGRYKEPCQERGEWSPLFLQDRLVGAVLRTRAGVKPLFVSPGHRVSLPTAIELTMACTGRFRQPEPLRAAHRLAASL
ncbi:MAG: deoxyribonuclease V [Deltaproteobacteria bacterium]|nr:deoxyribonuclease V [Deltaproteobacteria bacterium]